MLKKILIILLIVVLVVLLGAWPLSILGTIFEWLGIAIKWLAGVIDFFGWTGL